MNMARWASGGFVMVGCLLAAFCATAGAGVSIGDLNADGVVDIIDLNMVLIDWGKTGAEISDPNSDADDSGTITVIDLNHVLIHWGEIADFTLTVTSGSGGGTYTAGEIAIISANAPAGGYYFDGWVGDIATLADTNAADTTLTMPVADVAVTAAFGEFTYQLTVNSGSGDGAYPTATVVAILATASPEGQVFDVWLGDTAGIADVNSSLTTITIQPSDATITATYLMLPTYALTVISGTGDGNYVQGTSVGISADSAPSGLGFDRWLGDTTGVANVSNGVTSISTQAADATITATYTVTPMYLLTVTSGTGGGTYSAGASVNITAAGEPGGKTFNMWAGDRDEINTNDFNLYNTSLSFTMPGQDVTMIATYKDTGSPTDYWPAFNYFCKKYFGPEIESRQYEFDGNTLAFETAPSSEWKYVSKNSACIAFETSLPAKTYIEYGTTTSYGSAVYIETGDESERYYYLHLGYLTGLADNTTYHYRFVAEDERSNTITSSNKTFTTATPSGSVAYIPGSMGSAPYVLSSANTTYILTQDISAPGVAIDIQAHNVTVDLGGHTVTYNTSDNQITDPAKYMTDGAFGIREYWNYYGMKVVNGRIVQGAGYNTASETGTGYNPIHFEGSGSAEVAGVSLDYIGGQLRGIKTSNGPVHHNVIKDRGGVIINRHQGCDAIRGSDDAYNNLIKRARHRSIYKADNVYRNEIYGDSWATNAHAIQASSNRDVHDNHLFGGGYMLVGIACTGGAYSGGSTNPSGFIKNVDIYDNFIHFQVVRPYDDRSAEYGVSSAAHPVRLMWGIDNVVYHDNMLISYVRGGGKSRGLWLEHKSIQTDVVFRDNLIKTIWQDNLGYKGAAINVGGSGDWTATNDSQIMKFENNRVESNYMLTRIGGTYGQGCNTRFEGNTFVRTDQTRSDFDFVNMGYWYKSTHNNVFIDSLFEGGVSPYDYSIDTGWEGGRPSVSLEYEVVWTLTVETDPGASVVIKDKNNSTVFSGTADGSGIATVEITDFKGTGAANSSGEWTAAYYYNDHEVTVSKDGSSDSATVTVDDTKTLVLPVP